MNTELVVAVAQILTGAATLVVAIFLAAQFVVQRKVLVRAHEDADRELTLTSLGLLQEYLLQPNIHPFVNTANQLHFL